MENAELDFRTVVNTISVDCGTPQFFQGESLSDEIRLLWPNWIQCDFWLPDDKGGFTILYETRYAQFGRAIRTEDIPPPPKHPVFPEEQQFLNWTPAITTKIFQPTRFEAQFATKLPVQFYYDYQTEKPVELIPPADMPPPWAKENPQYLVKGTVISKPADPAMTHYTFKGWNPVLPSPIEDKTDVYAIMSKNEITLRECVSKFQREPGVYEYIPKFVGMDLNNHPEQAGDIAVLFKIGSESEFTLSSPDHVPKVIIEPGQTAPYPSVKFSYRLEYDNYPSYQRDNLVLEVVDDLIYSLSVQYYNSLNQLTVDVHSLKNGQPIDVTGPLRDTPMYKYENKCIRTEDKREFKHDELVSYVCRGRDDELVAQYTDRQYRLSVTTDVDHCLIRAYTVKYGRFDPLSEEGGLKIKDFETHDKTKKYSQFIGWIRIKPDGKGGFADYGDIIDYKLGGVNVQEDCYYRTAFQFQSSFELSVTNLNGGGLAGVENPIYSTLLEFGSIVKADDIDRLLNKYVEEHGSLFETVTFSAYEPAPTDGKWKISENDYVLKAKFGPKAYNRIVTGDKDSLKTMQTGEDGHLIWKSEVWTPEHERTIAQLKTEDTPNGNFAFVVECKRSAIFSTRKLKLDTLCGA